MSKLLRRAHVKRENAERNYQKIKVDDAYLDDCCYNLQQCIEFSLKYAIEMGGGRYVENHDIRAQLNVLNKLSIVVPNAELLRQNAQTINDWETSSRYKDSFIALIDDVDIARKCANDLLDFLDSCVITQEVKPMELFPDRKISDTEVQ